MRTNWSIFFDEVGGGIKGAAPDHALGDEREETFDLIEPGGIVAQLRGHRNASTRFARRDAAVTFEQHILQKIPAGDFLA